VLVVCNFLATSVAQQYRRTHVRAAAAAVAASTVANLNNELSASDILVERNSDDEEEFAEEQPEISADNVAFVKAARTLPALVIGSGPSKFIDAFCAKAALRANSFDDSGECATADNFRQVWIASDLERELYTLLSEFAASRVYESMPPELHRANGRAKRMQSARSSEQMVSAFARVNELMELTTKGAKHQHLAYIVLDLERELVLAAEIDTRLKYKGI